MTTTTTPTIKMTMNVKDVSSPVLLNSLHRQRGVALFMVMMVTLIIVALSVSLATGVFGEHKLSRSSADHAIARQGAEAALRDGEHDLNCDVWNETSQAFEFKSSTAGNKRSFCTQAIEACRQLGNLGVTTDNCDNGMQMMALSTSDGQLPNSKPMSACSVKFGLVTGQPQPAVDRLGAQPNTPIYSIEVFDYRITGGKGSTPIYRIRSRGYGRSETTTVDLEAIYRPCN
jgi:Tfp pilus assembly protein PilX